MFQDLKGSTIPVDLSDVATDLFVYGVVDRVHDSSEGGHHARQGGLTGLGEPLLSCYLLQQGVGVILLLLKATYDRVSGFFF